MLGLGSSFVKAAVPLKQYVKDNLKIYFDFASKRAKTLEFVGTGSLELQGSDDYVNTNIDSLTVHTNATMCYWVKFNTTDGGGDQRSGIHNSKRFYLGIDDATIAFGCADAVKTSTDVSAYITAGVWCHLAMVANNGIAYIYIDGVQRDTNTYTQASATNPDADIFIGSTQDTAGGVTARYDHTGNIKNFAL